MVIWDLVQLKIMEGCWYEAFFYLFQMSFWIPLDLSLCCYIILCAKFWEKCDRTKQLQLHTAGASKAPVKKNPPHFLLFSSASSFPRLPSQMAKSSVPRKGWRGMEKTIKIPFFARCQKKEQNQVFLCVEYWAAD